MNKRKSTKSINRRKPKDYDGSNTTSFQMKDLLPQILDGIGGNFKERGDLILAAWPEIIGYQFAPMTQAVSYENGVLTVKVRNSTLLSLLTQHEKPKLLKMLKDRFPQSSLYLIVFRLG